MAISQYFLPQYRGELLDQSGFNFFAGPTWGVQKRSFMRVSSNGQIRLPALTPGIRPLIATAGLNREILIFEQQAWHRITFQLYSLLHHEFLLSPKSRRLKVAAQHLFDNAYYLFMNGERQIDLPKPLMQFSKHPLWFGIMHHVAAHRLVPLSLHGNHELH